jgi:hypothetical protein
MMAANIEEGSQNPIRSPHRENRLASNFGGDIVAALP